MISIILIFYVSAIYFMFQRYQKTMKKAGETELPDEKEMLTKLANKRKKQAILAVLYMSFVIGFFVIMFLLEN